MLVISSWAFKELKFSINGKLQTDIGWKDTLVTNLSPYLSAIACYTFITYS